MSKLDKEQVIEQFTKAYQSANGKAPSIEAKGGWYSVDGGKNVRLAELLSMAEEMQGGAGASEKPVAKEKPAAKTKKEAPKAKAAPKKSKAAKAKTSDFSVKQFWAEKILATNAGSKLPR